MERILKVYTPEHGPLLEFIKVLHFLYKKYGYIYDVCDREDALKKLIKEEYGAVFINDNYPKLVFENEKQKTMFLIKFS